MQVRSGRLSIGDVLITLAGNTSTIREHLTLAHLQLENSCLSGEAFYCTSQARIVKVGCYVKYKRSRAQWYGKLHYPVLTNNEYNCNASAGNNIHTIYFLALQVQYGTLAAVFSSGDGTTAIVAPFLPLGITGLICRKYVRCTELILVETAAIIQDVSFVHTCGAGCTFLEDSGIRCVERENAHVSGGLLFCHDLHNEVYLLNCYSL